MDDGYSGGNFNRPGFKEMLKQLEQGKANLVITKDLSRLGRDMWEASYYAEQFFPEHGIQYIAIADNFDTEHDNIMAPFLFAMNEVYLRDGSRKVKDVLRSKRESGQYAEDGNACKHMAAVLFAIGTGETPLEKVLAKKNV